MTRDELWEQFRHFKIQLLDEIANHKCTTTDCTKCMFYQENARDFSCVSEQADEYLRTEARE